MQLFVITPFAHGCIRLLYLLIFFHETKLKGIHFMGIIEVDMFSRDVNDPNHPVAESFQELLVEVADQYGCNLLSFSVTRGIVSFSFDNEELMADIIKILQLDE